MSILFISDIHLCTTEPKITDGFLYFLSYRAVHAKALYILGDLFDKWLGDDDLNILNISIANALKKLVQNNVPCYFIHGNRDFLLGKKYADLCGIILLPEKKLLKLPSGKKIIILHGDILCVHDLSYQRFKRFLYLPIIKKLFLLLPLSIRSYVFNIIHFCSLKHKKSKKNMHIDFKKVIEMLIQNKADIMIHGHTHQLGHYDIYYSGKKIFNRIALGNWNKYGSMLEIHEKKIDITLIEFPLKK